MAAAGLEGLRPPSLPRRAGGGGDSRPDSRGLMGRLVRPALAQSPWPRKAPPGWVDSSWSSVAGRTPSSHT
eukprot:5801012-Lingulodinium_polyedra.AAC.1